MCTLEELGSLLRVGLDVGIGHPLHGQWLMGFGRVICSLTFRPWVSLSSIFQVSLEGQKPSQS